MVLKAISVRYLRHETLRNDEAWRLGMGQCNTIRGEISGSRFRSLAECPAPGVAIIRARSLLTYLDNHGPKFKEIGTTESLSRLKYFYVLSIKARKYAKDIQACVCNADFRYSIESAHELLPELVPM